MAELDAFLRDAEGRSFADGEWDCCLFPAAWVERVTGIDGAAPWRGRYRSRLGWLRILKREGGLAGVLSVGATLAGLAPTAEPKRGDIGLIEFGKGPTGGICLGDRWASAARHGLAVQRATVLMAWSVSCPKP